MEPPVGVILAGDQWVAMGDESNVWLQVGNKSDALPRLCRTYFEIYAKRSSWGIDNKKTSYESNYLCCAEATPLLSVS